MSTTPLTKLVQQDGRIELAIQAYQKGQLPSIRSAAQSYDIPLATLAYRLQGRVPRRDFISPNRKLTLTEEETLIQWILSADERGLAPRHAFVRVMADLLLAERPNPDTKVVRSVGKLWVTRFVDRHDELKSKFNRKYDDQRAKCEDPKIIKDWFRLVRNTKAKYGIADQDIYNFDETGFQMGVITTAKVVTSSERSGRPKRVQPGNRTWVTVIEGVNSYGWAIPPMIIFEGKLHQAAWYEEIPHNWTIAVSENGWTNDKIGYTWLTELFEKHTRNRTIGKHRLLILDGHGSHATPDFDRFCTEHSIIPLYMPPHSSHLLQPLDVGCFSPLKRSYGKIVEDKMRLGINHIDKLEFLDGYKQARKAVFSESNIRSGFAATGLVPYDPDRVLSTLNVQLRTPTPPLVQNDTRTEWTPETPRNIIQLERQTATVRRLLKRRTVSPPTPTKQALELLIKGCQMAMHSAVLLTQENKELHTANQKQRRTRDKVRSYVADRGVLTGEEGLRLIQSQKRAAEGEIEALDDRPRQRARPRCSLCSSYEHNARVCSERVQTNV